MIDNKNPTDSCTLCDSNDRQVLQLSVFTVKMFYIRFLTILTVSGELSGTAFSRFRKPDGELSRN